MEPQRLLRRKAASAYLYRIHGLERAASTLAKLAVIGGGPVFRRLNRVPLYSTDDLDEWVASKLSEPMRSTSGSAEFATEHRAATAQGTEPISSEPEVACHE
jgi:hypothetical protein